jgi:hypothetical protein
MAWGGCEYNSGLIFHAEFGCINHLAGILRPIELQLQIEGDRCFGVSVQLFQFGTALKNKL